MIFETGSMAPAVPVGALGFARSTPATSVERGDIVTVTADDGSRITHRVKSIDGIVGNSATLTLQGDANPVPDAKKYVVTEVRRIVATAPLLGYVASWLSNPLTLLLQALAVVFLLVVAFAPTQGWRRSQAAHRLVAGTAVVTVAALAATNVNGNGPASAAPLAASASATGTLNAGRPDNPTSLTCNDLSGGVAGIGSSITLTFPNPPEHAAYTYSIVTTGSGAPRSSTKAASSLANPAVVDAGSLGLVSWLLSLIPALLGGSVTLDLTLTNYIGNFRSTGSLTQKIIVKGGGLTGLVPQLSCVNPGQGGTVTGALRQRAMPGSTSATDSIDPTTSETSDRTHPTETTSITRSDSESSANTAPEEQSGTDVPAPGSISSTTTTPTLPPNGTATASKDFAFYQDGSKVTIRDTKSTDVVYRGSFSSAATVRWLPGTETLEVTEPDGSVTIVKQLGDRWVETVTPPAPTTTQTTERIAPTTETETEPVEARPSVTPTESVVPTE
ncbi:peptidase S26 [Gordonia phthalatica]|nr:peptidase S26 [Gordonia phthalatica]